VAQKLNTEPMALVRAFDQARNIGEHKG